MTHLLRNFIKIKLRSAIVRQKDFQIFFVYSRNISIVPNLYDGEHDPAPKFFAKQVQSLLKRLTRPDFEKVFRKRTNSGYTVLKTPRYKFLTDEELKSELDKAEQKASWLLQMPPVIKVQNPINHLLSKDPALMGYDMAKYLFTDISFGVRNEHRLIVERDPDGTLKSSDHDIRKRLNQTYFPINGRKIREPMMFTDEEKLNNLLDREKYLFVLDRACLQYEPDEPSYQKITSMTYQHVDIQNKYELLRSTRHFGSLVFYLTWHHTIDNLMLELLQTNAIREAVLLVAVRQEIKGDVANPEVSNNLVEQILATPIQLSAPEHLTSEDVDLDNKCAECIDKYIRSNSAMKSEHELALQGFKEHYHQLVELSEGLKKAHGNA